MVLKVEIFSYGNNLLTKINESNQFSKFFNIDVDIYKPFM